MRYSHLLFALSVLSVAPARAQAQDKKEEAKALFNAGAQAYTMGQYVTAVEAFEGAYKLTPLPAILFSLGQAERRQYVVDHKPERLQIAVASFRKYLEQVAQGGRRADAVAALEELEPLYEKNKGAMPTTPQPEVPKAPKVMITSAVASAKVTLDGKDAGDAPFIGEVSVGKHTVVVSAKGYDDDKREFKATEGLVALDLEPRERPAILNVNAPSGSEIIVDGRPAGTTPAATQIAATHGHHFVAVLKNGARAWSKEVDLVHGEVTKVDASVDTSTQRLVSWGFLGTGAAVIVTGGVFVGLALDRQHKAQSVLDARTTGNVTPGQLADYETARSDRDRFRSMSYLALGAGAALTTVGIVLYAFDRPTIAPREYSPGEKKPTTPTRPAGMEMAFAPSIGPGWAFGTFTAAF